MILELPFIFFFSFSSLFLLRKFARNINLVDKPNVRKKHTGAIPLVGGVSLYMVIAYYLLGHSGDASLFSYSWLYLLSVTVLISIGVMDDKYELSVKMRILVELVVTICMFYTANLKLHMLGDIFGFGPQYLYVLSLPVTIFAVIGAINAYNMVDGIDGLLGGLSLVSFAGIWYLLQGDEFNGLSNLCLVIMVALLPYILMNLGFLGRERKVFMGDAGSMLIGFTIIWMLLQSSQYRGFCVIRPVTALWLIGIPLMDMVSTIIRRVRHGNSPFKPDREHLHHIFQRLGFSPSQTLVIICCLSAMLVGFGVYGELYKISEAFMFYSYIICFFVYVIIVINLKFIYTLLVRIGVFSLKK